MRNIFKRGIVSVMAITTLLTAMTGIVSNAAEADTKDTAISIDDSNISTRKSFSFTNVGINGQYCVDSLTVTYGHTVTFSFYHCSEGAAHVSIRNASTDAELGAFVIPATAGTTLYYYINLPAGTYRFYVTPHNCNKTSGGFSG